MAQLTIELENDVLSKVRATAEACGMSDSEFISEMLRARSRDEWPQYVRDLAGAWPDFPEIDEIGAHPVSENGQKHS